MTTDNGLYRIDEALEGYKKRIANDNGITPANKKAILGFFDSCVAEGLSAVRVLFYAQRLKPLAEWLGKDFKTATKEDLEKLAVKIRSNSDFGEQTKEIYRISLMKFYRWLNNGKTPAKLKWFKAKRGIGQTKVKPEDLLTQKEVGDMVEACENPRDRAMVAVLAEGGFRVGELASMTVGSVSYDKLGARVSVEGKTGQRTVRLIGSVKHLTAWLAVHPRRREKDAPVWVSLSTNKQYEALRYNALRKQLAEIAVKAGVTKRVNPHSFRHASATRLFKLGVPTEAANAYFGWTAGTKMARTYSHLAGSDVDAAIARANGLLPQEETAETLACPRCATHNQITQSFCGKCGMPLTLNTAISQENVIQQFMEKVEPLMRLLETNKAFQEEVKRLSAQKVQPTVEQQVVLVKKPDLRQSKTPTADC